MTAFVSVAGLMRFAQSTGNKSILRSNQSISGTFVEFLLDAALLGISQRNQFIVIGQCLHQTFNIGVAFQKTDGQVSGGILRTQI